MMDLDEISDPIEDHVRDIVDKIGSKVVENIRDGVYDSTRSEETLIGDILQFYKLANRHMEYDSENPITLELPPSVHHLLEDKEIFVPPKGNFYIYRTFRADREPTFSRFCGRCTEIDQ